jgi:hypothetical protein
MSVNIGIDFDRCLTEAHTLVPFVLILEILLEKELLSPISKTAKVLLLKSRDTFYSKLADNEIATKGLIFRPSLLKLMPTLIHLRQQNKINKIFIYSNNTIEQLIHVCDYIMALVLQKAPYSVNKDALIQEGNRIHTLTPRIHMDNLCRSSEVMEGDFKEKTFEGIRACLGENISESDLWFIDDTLHHTRLVSELKERYIHVEQYTVKISNKRLAELFIESFSIDAFTPGNSTSEILLRMINRVLPGFRPSGKEQRTTLIEKFSTLLNKFTPSGGGRLISKWKDDHVQSDFLKIERALGTVLVDKPMVSSERYLPTGGYTSASAYAKARPSSLLRRNRILRTRRKSRK